ncbi:MAG TPA: hypothetical protein VLU24_12640 [Mycobacterium sp.]|nr:hypothetical protein [Mycobacterium sp.]
MSSFGLSTPRPAIAAVACSVLLAIGLPSATAAPATDGQGYVDSTARCTPPDTVVVFGSTESSRVAICRTPGSQYQYRGVRVRDGSKLILPASESGDGGFVADNDGVAYMVTASSLTVTADHRVIREEPMVDFHRPGAPAASAAPTTPAPTTPPGPPLPAEQGYTGR